MNQPAQSASTYGEADPRRQDRGPDPAHARRVRDLRPLDSEHVVGPLQPGDLTTTVRRSEIDHAEPSAAAAGDVFPCRSCGRAPSGAGHQTAGPPRRRLPHRRSSRFTAVVWSSSRDHETPGRGFYGGGKWRWCASWWTRASGLSPRSPRKAAAHAAQNNSQPSGDRASRAGDVTTCVLSLIIRPPRRVEDRYSQPTCDKQAEIETSGYAHDRREVDASAPAPQGATVEVAERAFPKRHARAAAERRDIDQSPVRRKRLPFRTGAPGPLFSASSGSGTTAARRAASSPDTARSRRPDYHPVFQPGLQRLRRQPRRGVTARRVAVQHQVGLPHRSRHQQQGASAASREGVFSLRPVRRNLCAQRAASGANPQIFPLICGSSCAGSHCFYSHVTRLTRLWVSEKSRRRAVHHRARHHQGPGPHRRRCGACMEGWAVPHCARSSNTCGLRRGRPGPS